MNSVCGAHSGLVLIKFAHDDEVKDGRSMVNVSFQGEKVSVVVWQKSAIELESNRFEVDVVL